MLLMGNDSALNNDDKLGQSYDGLIRIFGLKKDVISKQSRGQAAPIV